MRALRHRAACTAAAAVLLLLQACHAPRRLLAPDSIRAAAIPAPEQQDVLARWQLAVDFANDFLGSSFNRTLPQDARVRLDADGMRFVTAERSMPIRLVLVDDFRSSSCVCATVDTYKDLVYVHRPWGASTDLPIETCNTFFAAAEGTMDPDVDLATYVLRVAAILFYEEHAHISTWEWFRCQWLEWLIGSGHHRFSMQRPNAVSREVFFFWHGAEPATPAIERVVARRSGSPGDAARALAERRQGAQAWQAQFEGYLAEREEGAAPER